MDSVRRTDRVARLALQAAVRGLQRKRFRVAEVPDLVERGRLAVTGGTIQTVLAAVNVVMTSLAVLAESKEPWRAGRQHGSRRIAMALNTIEPGVDPSQAERHEGMFEACEFGHSGPLETLGTGNCKPGSVMLGVTARAAIPGIGGQRAMQTRRSLELIRDFSVAGGAGILHVRAGRAVASQAILPSVQFRDLRVDSGNLSGRRILQFIIEISNDQTG
jgi:hypothetical protein